MWIVTIPENCVGQLSMVCESCHGQRTVVCQDAGESVCIDCDGTGIELEAVYAEVVVRAHYLHLREFAPPLG